MWPCSFTTAMVRRSVGCELCRSRIRCAAPQLASDDLIPILVYVLIQARLEHLHSNIQYMELFSFSSLPAELSFNFVTFQGATMFMCSDELRSTRHTTVTISHRRLLSSLM